MKKFFLATLAFIIAISASSQIRMNDRSVEQKLNEEYATGAFRSAEGTILDVASNTSASTYFNILSWLDGRVAGVRVLNSRGGVKIPYIRGNAASIYVDEILVNPGYLNALPSSDIAMIKVIKTPFVLNTANAAGAIAIYTFKADEGDEDDENR